MPWLRMRALHVSLLLVLITYTVAQSSSDDGTCGSDITKFGLYYTVKFNTYCKTRLSSTNLTLPIKKSSFKDCANACVAKGKSCGGFAYDRDSHFTENNCYLNTPAADFQRGTVGESLYFDSAIIDNSSLPVVRVDCPTTGQNGVYQNYNVRCGTTMFSDIDPSQIETVFAASLSDCITHCKNKIQSDGSPLCYAVTWDPTTLHGYENCYLKTSNFVEPTINALWDSATLVGATGRTPSSTANKTSTSTGISMPSFSLPPSSSSSSDSLYHYTAPAVPTPRLIGIVCGVVGLVISIASIFWSFRRRRNLREAAKNEAAAVDASGPPTPWRRELGGTTLVEKGDDGVVRVHEMDAEVGSRRSELQASGWNAGGHIAGNTTTTTGPR